MHREYERAIELLESWAPDPHRGLPLDLFLFISRLVPMVNVDLLIKDDREQVLLTWRDDEIHGAGWHVPGGMIRFKESAADRIRATAREELGAEVVFEPNPSVEEIIEPERKLRGHHVALVYSCRLISELDETLRFKGGKPTGGQWAWHESCPSNLIAAHKRYSRFFRTAV
jgi:ADP-ribose pyrophosphatase YjhB (NUDIX family)